jgi:hypothetical protein
MHWMAVISDERGIACSRHTAGLLTKQVDSMMAIIDNPRHYISCRRILPDGSARIAGRSRPIVRAILPPAIDKLRFPTGGCTANRMLG